jgi:2-methylcitrate synthase
MLCYWYRYAHHGKRIEPETDEDTLAGHLLTLINGEKPGADYQRCMDISLIVYAEHEFNASTFTARVCASTLSDFHSCITGAIGSLRGPLHGGANEAAMKLISKFKTPREAREGIYEMLERREKIMGFGHAVYRHSDPRNAVIKECARKLAPLAAEGDGYLFAISEEVEKVMKEIPGKRI